VGREDDVLTPRGRVRRHERVFHGDVGQPIRERTKIPDFLDLFPAEVNHARENGFEIPIAHLGDRALYGPRDVVRAHRLDERFEAVDARGESQIRAPRIHESRLEIHVL
jgi:hypothetical protein